VARKGPAFIVGGNADDRTVRACAGPLRPPLDRIDQGCDPVGDIQGGCFPRQQVIAQGAQHLGQVAEQDLGGRVVLALAVAANQRDEPVGGGALGVEVVDSLAGQDRRDQS